MTGISVNKIGRGNDKLFSSPNMHANRNCSHLRRHCNNICSRPEETIIKDNSTTKRDTNSRRTTCV